MPNPGQSKISTIGIGAQENVHANIHCILGTVNRVSPRTSKQTEILQVGTPFRDVTNRNKSKRSSKGLGLSVAIVKL